MNRKEAIDHISRNKGKTFIVRPITFHGFAVLQITGANTAEVIIKDLTRAEASNIINKGLGYR